MLRHSKNLNGFLSYPKPRKKWSRSRRCWSTPFARPSLTPCHYPRSVKIMHIISESQVSAEHRISPKGAFEVFRKHMSLALGGAKDKGAWGGGHPFDIEYATIPAGKRNYPLHSHAAQTEYYIIVSGVGVVIDAAGREYEIKQGDHFLALPGEAHQLRARAESSLSYFVIADHHPADVTSYPKTGKRQIKPEYRVVSVRDVDYYDEEE